MSQPPPSLPYTFAKRHGVIVRLGADGALELAHLAEVKAHALIEARRAVGRPARLHEIPREAFDRLLQLTYEQGSGQAQEMAASLGEDIDLADLANVLPEPEDLLESADEAPIIRFINALLAEAVKEGASDIHLEPYEDRMVVRLRVDGMLREVLHPARALAPTIISRIKVMARLDIAEKRMPQDGRISLRVGGRSVDVRVSTLPSSHGERVVLRLLDKQAGKMTLEGLGMPGPILDIMAELIKRPHGIILVTGPTGSGKTTSIYAVLTRLNDRSRNIITVEDPIEYYLDGVGQTQVNARIDMTFAKGLRAILRQDPDVVMVGEIRDLETAEIAVQASLTGHLVLSTLHTNTAVGAITRLRDMGIEPFLVASSLIGVASQRLMRRLCTNCRTPYTPEAAELALLGLDPEAPAPTLYRPNGCPQCNHLGYKGRIGAFEVVPLDDEMRTLIHDGAGDHILERHARTLSPGIREVGNSQVVAGHTSMEELLRVIHAD